VAARRRARGSAAPAPPPPPHPNASRYRSSAPWPRGSVFYSGCRSRSRRAQLHLERCLVLDARGLLVADLAADAVDVRLDLGLPAAASGRACAEEDRGGGQRW